MITEYSNQKDMRAKALAYLGEKKFKRVIDIGGAIYPWVNRFATAYFDLKDVHEYIKDYPDMYTEEIDQAKSFIGDINDGDGWGEVYKDVEENGKFDFAVCTHTIEDIRNPVYVLRHLPDIAKEGFIAIPSKTWELFSGTECVTPEEQIDWGLTHEYTYRGFFHHRWIFTIIDDKLVGFPKLGFVDCMLAFDRITRKDKNNNWHELAFFWKEGIPFGIINNDFLGPNGAEFCKMYRELISKGV